MNEEAQNELFDADAIAEWLRGYGQRWLEDHPDSGWAGKGLASRTLAGRMDQDDALGGNASARFLIRLLAHNGTFGQICAFDDRCPSREEAKENARRLLGRTLSQLPLLPQPVTQLFRAMAYALCWTDRLPSGNLKKKEVEPVVPHKFYAEYPQQQYSIAADPEEAYIKAEPSAEAWDGRWELRRKLRHLSSLVKAEEAPRALGLDVVGGSAICTGLRENKITLTLRTIRTIPRATGKLTAIILGGSEGAQFKTLAALVLPSTPDLSEHQFSVNADPATLDSITLRWE